MVEVAVLPFLVAVVVEEDLPYQEVEEAVVVALLVHLVVEEAAEAILRPEVAVVEAVLVVTAFLLGSSIIPLELVTL